MPNGTKTTPDVKAAILCVLNDYVYTIEYQKQNLPHCHFLYILDDMWQDVATVTFAAKTILILYDPGLLQKYRAHINVDS